MSVREIRGHGLELYKWEGQPDLISTITDEVRAEVAQGRCARLRRCIPLCLDALRLQIRDEGRVKNKACILALGIRADGCKEVLGLWIEQTAGAKCWLKVFNDAQSGLSRYFDGRRGWIAWLPDATQPSIQTPKFKPAVSICSGTHWPLPTGKSANL